MLRANLELVTGLIGLFGDPAVDTGHADAEAGDAMDQDQGANM